MAEKKSNPIQSGFLLTKQEKIYILVICSLFILGLAARYLYLNNRNPSPSIPVESELNHE
ncbi:hypothetical protein P4C99_12835 [Pontiellaceae bacterium B1224]|nr:hypothetical protein [Pontiellaceae bacterium B1224]